MMPKEIKRDAKWKVIEDVNMGCSFFPPLAISITLFLAVLATIDFVLAKLIGVGIMFIIVCYLFTRFVIKSKAKKNRYTASNGIMVFSSFEEQVLISLPILFLCALFLFISFFNAIYVCLFFILPITSVFIFGFGELFLKGCKDVLVQIKLALKFGTSKLIHEDYFFKKGEVIGMFFQNEKLINYTDEITVTLKNIEEKFVPVRDTKNPRKVTKEHKFYCHYVHTRKYTLEAKKIGLVFKLPLTNCLATNYIPENPIYWEIEVKNEACGFHHRFIIDVLAIPDDNKGNL